ncbi:MAG: hypothetical protein EOP49_39345 [Sphingobacteriales bacterium]|nr:MAG: hypothetical protein EOP49_39345 [Sphingobacteriales bacterium]
MQSAKLQTIRLLNGLLLINNERTAGYKKMISLMQSDGTLELQYLNLQLLLSNFLHQSQLFSGTLQNILLIEGGKMPYGVKVDIQLYQSVREMKALFAGLTENNIRETANRCEQILVQAYQQVLNEHWLPEQQEEIVARQFAELKTSAKLEEERVPAEPGFWNWEMGAAKATDPLMSVMLRHEPSQLT